MTPGVLAPLPTDEVADQAIDRATVMRNTIERLRLMGSGIHWPTELRPHLCCMRRKKDDKPRAGHGVTFRRVGDDCLVEAHNGVVFVSILLEGEGENSPRNAVVPRDAMELVAGADEDLALFWFDDCKVYILVEKAVHEFLLWQPDLPMGQNLRASNLDQRSLAGVSLDARELYRVQQALACDALDVRHHSKGVLALYPAGDRSSGRIGFISIQPDESY